MAPNPPSGNASLGIGMNAHAKQAFGETNTGQGVRAEANPAPMILRFIGTPSALLLRLTISPGRNESGVAPIVLPERRSGRITTECASDHTWLLTRLTMHRNAPYCELASAAPCSLDPRWCAWRAALQRSPRCHTTQALARLASHRLRRLCRRPPALARSLPHPALAPFSYHSMQALAAIIAYYFNK
jgi:hypothetical protein